MEKKEDSLDATMAGIPAGILRKDILRELKSDMEEQRRGRSREPRVTEKRRGRSPDALAQNYDLDVEPIAGVLTGFPYRKPVPVNREDGGYYFYSPEQRSPSG